MGAVDGPGSERVQATGVDYTPAWRGRIGLFGGREMAGKCRQRSQDPPLRGGDREARLPRWRTPVAGPQYGLHARRPLPRGQRRPGPDLVGPGPPGPTETRQP